MAFILVYITPTFTCTPTFSFSIKVNQLVISALHSQWHRLVIGRKVLVCLSFTPYYILLHLSSFTKPRTSVCTRESQLKCVHLASTHAHHTHSPSLPEPSCSGVYMPVGFNWRSMNVEGKQKEKSSITIRYALSGISALRAFISQ